ncbi:MAG: GNAT family N-acetyltransferase, partial [Polyangiaceae bacterium]
MVRGRIVKDIAGLSALVPAWRHLLARASNAQPALTPLWLLAWWREFGDADGRALRVVAVEDAGELVGLVPLSSRLSLHRRAIPVRRVELLASGEEEADEIGSDYLGGLTARGREADVAVVTGEAVARGDAGAWDELRMPAMSGDDALVAKLASELRRRGVETTVESVAECPFIPLPATWDAYVRALGPSQRYAVVRSLRELEKWAGKAGWELRSAAKPEDLREGRRVLRDLHAHRWRASGRAGAFASVRFSRFHDEVMPRLCVGDDGASLDLLWLLARGEPIAASYSIRFGGKVHFYQSGRRVDLPKALRPGIALHALAIR